MIEFTSFLFILIFGIWLYYILSTRLRIRETQKVFAYLSKKNTFRTVDFFKWQITRKRGKWPKWLELKHYDNPPLRVFGSHLRVSYVNHSTVLIQTQGLNILTDPVWSRRVGPAGVGGPVRVHNPGIPLSHLPPIDYILISHNHYDHLDLPTVKQLYNKFQPKIFAGLGVKKNFRSRLYRHIPVHELDWGGSIDLNTHVKLHFRPVDHWSGRTAVDRNHTLWGAYVLQIAGGSIYFAGDTSFEALDQIVEDSKEFGPIRLALLPIGPCHPRWFLQHSHMDAQEAVKTHMEMNAQYSLAIHYGTFRQADDAYEDSINLLIQTKNEYDVPEERFRIVPPGSHWNVPQD